MKKMLSILLCVLMCAAAVPAFAQDDSTVTVRYDMKTIEFDQGAFILNGRTLVPMRKIFETLGASVDWDEGSRKVTAKKENKTVEITIDSDAARVNGEELSLDVPAQITAQRTMVPLRFIGEAMGCTVRWDGVRSTVDIYSATEEVVASLEKLDTLVDEKTVQWLASLYDPETGGFYYSLSARDNENFYPDLESTMQVFQVTAPIGMNGAEAFYNRFSDKVNQKFVKFAQDMQSDDDGYFYHPQWGKAIYMSRKERDLTWGTQLITYFSGGKETPKYKLPSERIAIQVKTVADSSELPEYLRSKDGFLKWFDSRTC